jgi:hypothetical protein
MTDEVAGEWLPDPALAGRQRYRKGARWTSHVADPDGTTYQEVWLGEQHVRWQYGVINIGMFGALDRMQAVFGELGQHGWELVTVYDKASNWFNAMEKGFMLFKRPVPPGERLEDDDWCIAIRV